jgi:ATP-dependent helicase/nuclease subunit B
LKRLLPGLEEEPFVALNFVDGSRAGPRASAEGLSWTEAEHAVELAPVLLRNRAAPPPDRLERLARFETLEAFRPLLARWRTWTAAAESIGSAGVERLFGSTLRASVSRLEEYAQCPFRFLVARGLRAEARKEFEIDEGARGEFQHEALKEFHQRLQKDGKRWRDLTPAEARGRIRSAGERLVPGFRGGLFAAAPGRRFQAELLIQQLERLIEVLVGWAPQCGFDPHSAELGFGFAEGLPGWEIRLDEGRKLLLRGYIDRLDLYHLPDEDAALASVIDYKSSVRPLDPTKLHHGLQLQLLSYLGVLRRLGNRREVFGVAELRPAGGFYVSLSGRGRAGRTRNEVLEADEDASRLAYRHTGRFDARWLTVFDTRPDRRTGDQFKWKLNNDNSPSKSGNEALPTKEFERLLDENEGRLLEFGRKIFAGEFPVAPFRLGSQTACDFCDFRAACRFDPWARPYRMLRPPPEPSAAGLKSGKQQP